MDSGGFTRGNGQQNGLGRQRARQQAKAADSLKALPTTLEAVKGGWISIDHARVIGESHQRAPLAQDKELELITLAISEDLDQFKKTVARGEDQRRADEGMTRHERQRERRSAKVFDGDNEMVILHAELDRIAGERVKTALHDLITLEPLAAKTLRTTANPSRGFCTLADGCSMADRIPRICHCPAVRSCCGLKRYLRGH